MQNLSNNQKAELYNKLLFQFQRLQEQVRLIKAENLEVSPQDQQKINVLESQMRQLYNQTQKLF
jgi:protein involved in polysaccharide export with SLBB domain